MKRNYTTNNKRLKIKDEKKRAERGIVKFKKDENRKVS